MKKSILIVDDSESIRELVGKILENADYTVYKAINGRDALDTLAEMDHLVSLIITDLFMPVMDGFGFINEIRNDDKYRFTPILMLTTESHMEKKLEAKKAGVTGWMVKPFEENKLLKIVHKVIR
ncbi:MAG: response regulator [Bacteroidota bacterium]